jgi:CBS domain-containing protein
MRCDELMTTEIEIVGIGETVGDAARKMRDANVGFIPVCQSDGSPLGTLTDRDIAIRVVAEDRPATTPVEEVMSTELVSCKTNDDILRAQELMRVNLVNRILCVDEAGRLAGILSLSDFAQYDDEQRVGALARDIASRETSTH